MNRYLARADGAVAVADHGDLLRLGQGGGDLSSYFGQHLHKITFRTFFVKGVEKRDRLLKGNLMVISLPCAALLFPIQSIVSCYHCEHQSAVVDCDKLTTALHHYDSVLTNLTSTIISSCSIKKVNLQHHVDKCSLLVFLPSIGFLGHLHVESCQ